MTNENRVIMASERKAYSTPELIEYGSVAKITEGGAASTRSDAGNNLMRPP